MESDDLRTRLRQRLSSALRDQDRPAVSALRSALAALDNAEAVQPAAGLRPEASEYIAGGVAGLGAAEVERRVLDAESQGRIVKAESRPDLPPLRRTSSTGRTPARLSCV